MADCRFSIGDKVKDKITGFEGIVVVRSQWLNNCNTYGVQPTTLKDGAPQERQSFDEPQLELVERGAFKPQQTTGGPERALPETRKDVA